MSENSILTLSTLFSKAFLDSKIFSSFAFTIGKLTVNVLPLFNSLLSSIFPLCNSTIDLTSANPIPLPSFSL